MPSAILRDGSTTSDVRLDRLRQFDPASRGYSVAPLLTARPEKGKSWGCPIQLDQLQEGSCVGMAFSHELAASPIRVPTSYQFAREIYWDAQRIDPWEGGSYAGASPRYEGTSVLAGVKVCQNRGFFEGYRWAFNIDDAIAAVVQIGPAVIGVDWMESMFSPRPSGLLEVDRNSRVAGGHAICWRGSLMRARLRGESGVQELARLRNSWGKGWGKGGDCFMRLDDLEWLLNQGGECVIPVGRAQGLAA